MTKPSQDRPSGNRLRDKLTKNGRLIRLPDGRVKIPVVFADHITNPHTGRPYSRSTLVRYNQGVRELSNAAAIQIIALFKKFGFEIVITDIIPDLEQIRPYLCKRRKRE